MNTDGELEFREYEPGDEEGIFDLMKDNWSYLNKKDALKNWRWLYLEGPYGKATIVVCMHGKKIVGHYAMFPLNMCKGDIEFQGGKAEGSVVHPEYRGNIAPRFYPELKDFRIFGNVISELWDRISLKGTEIVWGFPNNLALNSQVRAGYEHVVIPRSHIILPIDMKRTRKIHPMISTLNGLRSPLRFAMISYLKVMGIRGVRAGDDPKIRVRLLDPTADRKMIVCLMDKFRKENDVLTIKRDADYLKWRFLDNPIVRHRVFVSEYEGRLTSLITVKVNDKDGAVESGTLVDVIALHDYLDHAETCLSYSMASLKDEGAAYVDGWIGEGNVLDLITTSLKRNGFIFWPRFVDRKGLNMIVKVFNDRIDSQRVKDPHSWYITIAFTEGTS